jgi:hypothetical protein
MRALIAACAAIITASLLVGKADAKMPALYSNCGHLNVKYPHGLGRANAHDVTKGDSAPVTNFTRNTKAYNLAISYNKGLDRDHDGVACEKA